MEIQHRDTITILRHQETEFGAEHAEAFKTEAFAAISPKGGSVAIDLSSVLFMDSCGLTALIAVTKRARAGGGLVLFGVRPAVHEILRLTRLDGIFPIARSEEDAISFLMSGGEEKQRRAS